MRLLTLFGVLDRAVFPDAGDFDLPWIAQFGLDLAGDVFAEHHGLVVVNFIGLDNDADLEAGLKGVAHFHAREFLGDSFQVFQPLDIGLQHLAPRTGTCAG